MNHEEFEHNEPWQDHFYRTGSTNPPKGNSKLLIVLLVAVILLGGISSVLGIMNVRLWGQVSTYEQENNRQPQFHPGNQESSVPNQAAISNSDGLTLELESTPIAPENMPQEGGLSLQQIYADTIDSVVSISCSSKTGSSTGTGVVMDAKGHIVTNCHVVEGAKSVEVLLSDNRILPAMVVGQDKVSDVAVLYVDATDLKPARFGDSASLQVGDAVVAIGDPLGVELRGTMTNGIVSAINRDITTQGRTMTLIQTNAALNAGNSGGPLINSYGQVIGINTMKIGDYVNQAGVEGLGFAIPTATVKEVVDQLLNQGYVTGRPALGLSGETVSAFLQHYYRLPAGVYVTQVTYGEAANLAGLEPGDIILTFGKTRVTSVEELTSALYAVKAGDQITVTIYRRGSQKQLTLTVGQAVG